VSEHKLPAVLGPLTPAQIAAQMATGHSVFSPSASEMTMTCEESLVLNVLAEDRQTYEAAEGTVAHSCGEHWLKTGERPDEWIGYTEVVGGFEIEITEEMLGFVEDYVDWCQSTMAVAEDYLIEGHVDISPLTPIPGQGGTGDFIAFAWQWMRIIDLKYGKDPVFARGNKQLRIYALGVFYEWDWLYNFQTIEICIAQPRVAGGLTSWTISREELLAFADEARDAWRRSWQPRHLLTRTPSPKGCRWCAVRATCPAAYLFLAEETDVFENYDAQDAVIDVIPTSITYERMAAANDQILDEFAPSPFPAVPDPVELSTLALSKLLRYRKMMESFFNAVNAELLGRAISREEELLWWKVVESRTRRKLVEDEDWIISSLMDKGLKKSDLFVTKMKSPAELERTLHLKLKMTLGAAKKLLDEGGFTVKPPGQKTLAAVDDPRLAAPKDGDVFDNYDDEDI
jgi:hypothetical protein